MSVIFNTRLSVKHDTTANWNSTVNFIPLIGELIVYDDYQTLNSTTIPGVKIGDGTTDVKLLPFITDKVYSEISSHINNSSIHVASADRANWNEKVKVEVSIADEQLKFKY